MAQPTAAILGSLMLLATPESEAQAGHNGRMHCPSCTAPALADTMSHLLAVVDAPDQPIR